MDQVKLLQKKLAANPNDSSAVTSLLKLVRDNNIRCCPELVARCGHDLLRRNPSALGSSVWNAYEQVLIASLDIGHFENAEYCLDKLTLQFPSSARVDRLTGMIFEAKGEFDKAALIYAKILKDHPLDELARKRSVCVLRAQGHTAEATKELAGYLKDNQADLGAWKELSDLYLKQSLYRQARFCVEEVMMTEPHNHVWYTLCGEILYTIDELALARKFYAHSINLNASNNLRALYGLLATTSALQSKGSKDKDNTSLQQVASVKILAVYLALNSPHTTVVKRALTDLTDE